MGLDMYLRANKYISKFDYFKTENGLDKKENSDFENVASLFGIQDKLDQEGFSGISISYPMGYWRKSNHIHNWFVENVQDGEDNCASYYVSRGQLKELKSLCQDVLNAKHEDISSDLLPTGSGFFFGSTDYDEYYYQDVESTVEIIDRCLALDEDFDLEYQSSW